MYSYVSILYNHLWNEKTAQYHTRNSEVYQINQHVDIATEYNNQILCSTYFQEYSKSPLKCASIYCGFGYTMSLVMFPKIILFIFLVNNFVSNFILISFFINNFVQTIAANQLG
jgi:hypothetical protein